MSDGIFRSEKHAVIIGVLFGIAIGITLAAGFYAIKTAELIGNC